MSNEYDEDDDELRFIAKHTVKRNISSDRHTKVNLRIDPNESENSDVVDINRDVTVRRNTSAVRSNRYAVVNDDDSEMIPVLTDDIIHKIDLNEQRETINAFCPMTENDSDHSSNISDDVLNDIEGITIRTGERSKSLEDLLSDMKIDDDERSHFLDNFKQILNHESRHLVLLNTIKKYKYILKDQKVSDEILVTIFYNIDDLFDDQNNLVTCLETMIAEWDLNKHLFNDMLDIYILLHMRCKEYVKNIANATTELRSLFEKNEKLVEAMQMVVYEGSSLRLEVLIAKPTNWLCNSLENIKSLIETTEGECDVNIIKETWERLKDDVDVRLTIPNSTLEKNSFIRSAMFIELLPNDQRRLRHMFLFSGMAVCAKQRLYGDGFSRMRLSGPTSTEFVMPNKSPNELRFIERLEVKWFIPIQNLVIHPSKIIETCDKRKLEISNLKEKIRDLKMQFIAEKARVSENFSFRNMIIKKDVDRIQNQIAKAQSDLMKLSPTISFVIGNVTDRPHHLLVFSVKDLELWKRDILELRKQVTVVDTSGSSLANLSAFIESYRGYSSIIEAANAPLLRFLNNDWISGIAVTTVESLDGLNPMHSYYMSIEVDSFTFNEVQARTKQCSNCSSLIWNETFDIDLDCSHIMTILLYQVNNCAEEQESLYGYFEFKLDVNELDNQSVTKTTPILGDDSGQLQITVSFKIKTKNEMMKRKPSQSKTSVFGVPLETIIMQERINCNPPVENVPLILYTCLKRIEDEGLDEKGIYRISGNKNDITEFYKRLNRNVVNALKEINNFDLHTTTGIVKLYLRELPEPLMLSENYSQLIQISNVPEEAQRYVLYSNVIRQLPEPNHSTLVHILKHFQRVVAHSDKNNMVASNLGLTIGPTLILPPCNNTDKNSTANFAMETMNSMFLSRIFTQLLNGICSGQVDLDPPS